MVPATAPRECGCPDWVKACTHFDGWSSLLACSDGPQWVTHTCDGYQYLADARFAVFLIEGLEHQRCECGGWLMCVGDDPEICYQGEDEEEAFRTWRDASDMILEWD